MSESPLRLPLLDKLYDQYLEHENSAEFIRVVSEAYSLGTVCRLAQFGKPVTRRAAVLVVGFLGSYSENEILGAALCDSDRAVRMLADHGIRDLWGRQGTSQQQAQLQRLYQLISRNRMEEAIELANQLIGENDKISEAWSQRAIALSATGEFCGAVEDCCEALNCNRYHFPAAMGMGHCCLQMGDLDGALQGFRLALKINPDLEDVRTQIHQIERKSEN